MNFFFRQQLSCCHVLILYFLGREHFIFKVWLIQFAYFHLSNFFLQRFTWEISNIITLENSYHHFNLRTVVLSERGRKIKIFATWLSSCMTVCAINMFFSLWDRHYQHFIMDKSRKILINVSWLQKKQASSCFKFELFAEIC